MGLRSIFLLINLEMIICSQTADSHGTQINFYPYKLRNDYLQSDGRFTWDSDHFFCLNLEMIICSQTADSHGTQINFSPYKLRNDYLQSDGRFTWDSDQFLSL